MTAVALFLWQLAAPATSCASLADSITAVSADTTSARPATLARRLDQRCHDDFDALFSAGAALARAVPYRPFSVGNSSGGAAVRLLARAVALRPKHAGVWLAYSVALRKTGGVQVDANRAIQTALRLVDEFPDSTPAPLLAQIYAQAALYLQDWVDRTRWLKDGSRLGVVTLACANLGAFCENFTQPARFNDELDDAAPVDPGLAERRETLLRYYGRALRFDPTNLDVALRDARELALGEEWEQVQDLADARGAAADAPGLLRAVAGLARYRLGRYAAADSAFEAAIPKLPDSLRRWYDHPPRGLDTVPDYWSRARPLWLTPFNEIRLEYWARVTYALLVLHDREGGVSGPETPQGDALLRYGWPQRVTQVERDAQKVLDWSQQYNALYILGCLWDTMDATKCEPGGGSGHSKDVSGGRWVFWTYEHERPSMIFEQRPGIRVARYEREAPAEQYAGEAREATPLTFRSKLVTRPFRLPVQVARFRGTGPDRTAVALFGLVPARQMELPPADSIATALFVFYDTVGMPPVARQNANTVPGAALALTYRVTLPTGRYVYSMEAFSSESASAAVARDSLRAPYWAAGALSLSDLVVAHRADPPEGGAALTWSDLRLEPSRTLEVTAGSALWLVWEVYGLPPDSRGLGTYDVTLSVLDRNDHPLAVRLLSRLGLRRPPAASAVTLQWRSERPEAADGRALEVVAVQLPPDARGAYRLRVTARDAAGREAASERDLGIIKP